LLGVALLERAPHERQQKIGGNKTGSDAA